MYSTLYPHLQAYFPRATFYRRGNIPGAFCEAKVHPRHFPYSERHLQCLWADPRLRPTQLKTTEGETIRVEHPGEWNLEAGPDFLNAVLWVGTEKRRVAGDLEVHIFTHGWTQHGHDKDPRFSKVRFHLVYFPGSEIPGLIQIPLQEALLSDPRFSFDNIDTTAYPYCVPAGRFPLRTIHPDQKTVWLESAGEERLRNKSERLTVAIQNKDPEQVLWEEISAALGYKQNKAPARRLARLLPLARVRSLAKSPDEAYALLLGLSGLLPDNTDSAWDAQTQTFVRTTWDFWWKQSPEIKEQAMHASAWSLASIRPTNHPVRRLMAAAHYAFQIPELATHNDLLTAFTPNHWDTHINWKKSCRSTALVGTSRANAIVTNILVPWRAATGRVGPALNHLPIEPMNSIIRQTAHALFGPDHSPKVYRSSLARQGLIQVFHDYLITHRLDELKPSEICRGIS
jgi:hypothetical protein